MKPAAFDNNKSVDEGWCISECHGSENGPWQLQKCDEQDVFKTDIEAWRHVVTQSQAGSQYHTSALEFLQRHNPIEYDVITNTIVGKTRAIA